MQLDRTRIAIRQRGILELADLALMLLHRYASPLLAVSFLSALPWALLDLAIVGWIPWTATVEDYDTESFISANMRYLWLLSILVYTQGPLAFAPLTAWIGRAVFQDRPTARDVWLDTKATFWRQFLLLGLKRGALPGILIVLLGEFEQIPIELEVFALIVLVCVVGGIRLWRPFLPEILILERCPIRTRNPELITCGRRSSALHTPISSELFSRALAVICFSFFGIVALSLGIAFIRAYLSNTTGWTLDVPLIWIPAAMWAVAAGGTILRFLNYIDSRIRLEGWEVELTLRAEAERWTEKNELKTA